MINSERRWFVYLAVIGFFLAIAERSACGRTTPSPSTGCTPYAYCDGEKFAGKMELHEKYISCDSAPVVKERCCLPNARHMVCYNITLEGKLLIYNGHEVLTTTNFSKLCEALLAKLGKTPSHSAVSLQKLPKEKGKVHMIYRYYQWKYIDGGEDYVKDLACGFKEN